MRLKTRLFHRRSFIFFVLLTLIWKPDPTFGGDEIACDEICQTVVSGVSEADWYFHTGDIKLKCETTGQLGEQCLAYEQVYSGEMWNTIVLALTAAASGACVAACALQLAGNPLGAAAGAKCATLGFTELASEAAATVALHWDNLIGQGNGKDIATAWLSVGAVALGGGLKATTKMTGLGAAFQGLDEAGDAVGDVSNILDGDNASEEDQADADVQDQAKDVKNDLTQKGQVALGEGVTGGAALTGLLASKSVGLVRKIQAKNGKIAAEKLAESKEKQEKAESCLAASIFTTMLGFRIAEQAILPKLKGDFCDVIQLLGPRDGSPMQDPCANASPTSTPSASSTGVMRDQQQRSLRHLVSAEQLMHWLDHLSQSLWINQSFATPITRHPNISQLFQACQSEGAQSCRLLNSTALKGALASFPQGQDFSAILPMASDVSSQLSVGAKPRASDLLRYALRNQSLPDRPQLPIDGIFSYADIVQDNALFLRKEIEAKVHHSLFHVTGFQERQLNPNRGPADISTQPVNSKSQIPSSPTSLPALSPVALQALDVADSDIYHSMTTINLFQIISFRIGISTKQWPTLIFNAQQKKNLRKLVVKSIQFHK